MPIRLHRIAETDKLDVSGPVFTTGYRSDGLPGSATQNEPDEPRFRRFSQRNASLWAHLESCAGHISCRGSRQP